MSLLSAPRTRSERELYNQTDRQTLEIVSFIIGIGSTGVSGLHAGYRKLNGSFGKEMACVSCNEFKFKDPQKHTHML